MTGFTSLAVEELNRLVPELQARARCSSHTRSLAAGG
jgi:hypothetical protein